MNNEKIAVVLEQAAELLEGCGWTQHHYLDGFGRMCSLGALAAAGDMADDDCVQALADTIREIDPEFAASRENLTTEGQLVVFYNDDPSRTKQQILDLFHRATKKIQGVEA